MFNDRERDALPSSALQRGQKLQDTPERLVRCPDLSASSLSGRTANVLAN